MKYCTIIIVALWCISVTSGWGRSVAPLAKPLEGSRVNLFELSDVHLTGGQLKNIEELSHKYLLTLDVDRLLSWFRREAGLTPLAQPYPQWESVIHDEWSLAGHIMGFYLSGMAMMYQTSEDPAILERLNYAISGLKEAQEAGGDGYIAATRIGRHVFEDVASGNFKTTNPMINSTWEPVYVMNKLMLGLYDAYVLCNIDQAREVLVRLADWFGQAIIDKLDHDTMQKLLFCEHGSINESYVDVYRLTGNEKYSMKQVLMINNRPVKIWTDFIEPSAMKQIENLCSLPFLFHHLAIMPDVHTGMGMPIGGVLACKDAVIPNAVGVDIGCGMCAVKSNWKVSEISKEVLKEKIMSGVRNLIPLGMDHHQERQDEKFMPQGHDFDKLTVCKTQYLAALRQVGTLGGGNHFIEFQKDEEDNLWIMIHSGSRNLGKQVGDYYNKIAATLNERYYSVVSPDIHLPFLPLRSKEFNDYWADMQYCIDFALCNRSLMMERIKEVLTDTLPGITFEPMINIAHNYAAWENHFGKNVIVHRKGATLAREGITGIIPGSMGTASYIVEGLGNPESFSSCSHGAGRTMSRSAAINNLDLEKEIRMMDEKGIIHGIRQKKDLDEAASAYKDIEFVMANQQDLIKIKTRLLPVAVIKGS